MKFKSCIIACSIFSLAAKTTIYFPKHLSASLMQSCKSDIEFAFDIHDVLVQKNNEEQKQIKHKHRKTVGKKKMAIVGDIFKRILFWLPAGKNYKLYKEISQLQKQNATGQAFAQVFTHYNDPQMASYVKERANAQNITPGMEKMIAELSKQFTLRIASNIGDQFYLDLKQKHASFFKHFNDGSTVAYRYGQNAIAKPYDTFYQQHNKIYNPDGKKIILFVDDKKENVKAAAKHGWVGIHIDKKKNQAHQLREALQKLKIIT